jgi:hypothetical protein
MHKPFLFLKMVTNGYQSLVCGFWGGRGALKMFIKL